MNECNNESSDKKKAKFLLHVETVLIRRRLLSWLVKKQTFLLLIKTFWVSLSLSCLAQLFVVKITQKGKLFVELATTIESPLLFPTLDEGNCRWHHVSKEFSERCDNTWGNNRIILSQTNKHMCTQNTKRPPRTRAAHWRLKRAKAHLWLDSNSSAVSMATLRSLAARGPRPRTIAPLLCLLRAASYSCNLTRVLHCLSSILLQNLGSKTCQNA